MHNLHMPQTMHLALQYSTTVLPPALGSSERLILAAPRILALIFEPEPKHAQNELVLPRRKF